MFTPHEFMFAAHERTFTALELMFTVHEHNFSRYKDTFSFRFHQRKVQPGGAALSFFIKVFLLEAIELFFEGLQLGAHG